MIIPFSWIGTVYTPGGGSGYPVTVPAEILGNTTPGSVLSITGIPPGMTPTSYQWRRNGANISGATGATYTVVTADGGTSVSVVVTCTVAARAIPDVTAPAFSSAVVQNATPTTITITMTEALDAGSVPASSAFTITGKTVTGVGVSGANVNLTVNTGVANGATITGSYTMPGTNRLRDAAGNNVATIASFAITNNVQPVDVTAPVFVSAAISNSARNKIVLTFGEALSATLTGSATLAGTALTVTGHVVVGSTVEITTSGDFAFGDAPTVSYPAGYARDAAGNQAVAGANRAVTNNIVEPGFIATTFDALPQYTGAWVPDTAMTTVVTPAQTMPTKSTSATAGGYTDANFGTAVQKIAQPSDTNDPAQNFLRHDYSRRSPWNADTSKHVLLGENGWWQLFDSMTYARIPGTKATSPGVNALNGPAGQCEWCWHQTDPNKAVHTGNNGSLIWYQHDLVTQSSTVLFDLTAKLAALGGAWATAGRTSFKGEGMPSLDWRYFVLFVTTTAFGTIGVIRYDRTLDVIDWVLPLTNTPDHVSTAPLSGRAVVSWYGSAAASLALENARAPNAAAGARVFDCATNDQQGDALCVVGQHSDLFIDHLNREAFAWITFHGDADGLLDGSVCWCLLDDPSQRWATPIRVFPEEAGIGRGVHISGTCWDRPGYTVVSIYSGTANNAHSGRIMVAEMVPGGEVYRAANNYADTGEYDPETENGLAYACEPQAVASRDLTRIMFASNMLDRANGIMAMQVVLPSDAFPPAGLEVISLTTAPTVSGTATPGGTLTAVNAVFAGVPAPTTVNIWQISTDSGASWADIGGATSTTSPTLGSIGTQYRRRSTGTQGATSITSYSNEVTVAALSAPSNTVTPSVASTSTDNVATVFTPGTWTGNPVPTLTYVIQQNTGSWVDTAYTGVLSQVLAAGSYRLQVSGSNSQGGPIVAYSNTVTVTAVPQRVQASTAFIGTSPSLPASTPVGRLVVLDVAQNYQANPPRTISTVTLNGVSMGAAKRSQVKASGNLRVDTYSLVVATEGVQTATITLSGAGNYTAILTEYRGATAVSGTPVGAEGTSTSAAPGSMTPPGNAVYHSVVATTNSYETITPDATYSEASEIESGSGATSMNVHDFVGSGASNPVTTLGVSVEWVAQNIAFA